jgi:hypothetical protein
MVLKTLAKDPNAILDYTFDWDPWLDVGETISSHTATVVGAVKDSSANSTTAVTIWVSGGTADTTATVACRIVTSAARTDERTIALRIQDR